MLGPLKENALRVVQLDTVGSREAAQRAGNLRPVASVDEAACTLCGACQAVCPTEAITLGTTAVKVNAETCCGCGACVEVCPTGAIRLG
jgi:ferredoxin